MFVIGQLVRYKATGSQGTVKAVNPELQIVTVKSSVGGIQCVSTGHFDEFEPVLKTEI